MSHRPPPSAAEGDGHRRHGAHGIVAFGALRAARGQMVKKIPQRTCVACRTTRPKRHLVRVVRLAEGDVIVDRTGKQNGRGAYLCPAQECWQLAAKRKSLDGALATTVTENNWVMLNDYAEGLPERKL